MQQYASFSEAFPKQGVWDYVLVIGNSPILTRLPAEKIWEDALNEKQAG